MSSDPSFETGGQTLLIAIAEFHFLGVIHRRHTSQYPTPVVKETRWGVLFELCSENFETFNQPIDELE